MALIFNVSQGLPVFEQTGAIGVLLSRLPERVTPLQAGCALIAIIAAFQAFKSQKPKGRIEVLTEGSSNLIGSYFSANEFLKDAKNTLRRCYYKWDKATFRVAEMEQWTTIINKIELVDEIRMAPDQRLSFLKAADEIMSSKHTFGEDLSHEMSQYHAAIIRNQLNRNLPGVFENLCDEISSAMNDTIPQPEKAGDWVPVHVLSAMCNVICRASNRIFVGLPLCRNAEWVKLNTMYVVDIANKSTFLRRLPNFVRPFFGFYYRRTDKSLQRAVELLGPILAERMRLDDENGSQWPGRPNDMLSWMLDEAPPNERRNIPAITKKIILTNFAAIHTSSNTFGHALLHLAASPEYIKPLREEVENVIRENGWTKVAMTKMWKLDSFLKESQRLNGIGLTGLLRKALQDTELSDGTFIPKGSFLAVNMVTIHNDPEIYPSPDEFHPWRFSEMREASADDALKHQAVNTSKEYLTFGLGKHACPGRFFAVNELKSMMAYIVMHYDVKMKEEGVRPANFIKGLSVFPNPMAMVLFRKRA